MLKAGLKPNELSENGIPVKLEETFAMVRDAGPGQGGINEASNFDGLNDLAHENSPVLGGASAFRELPGDENDGALVREDF